MDNSRMSTRCGSCGGRELRSVVFLGYQQLACTMPPMGLMAAEERHFPLELLECPACGLAQLSCIVKPEIVFHRDYPYSSGNTKALWEDFIDLHDSVASSLQPGDVVVDIGANDGTLLRCFSDTVKRIAVEPTDQVLKAVAHGILPVQTFFGKETGRVLAARHGKAKVITACNVMAHIEDIHGALDGVVEMLDDDGVFVAENHDLHSVIEGNQWDTIYHEHLRFYTPASWAILLSRHGLRVNRVEKIPTHGGSFRAYASKTATPEVTFTMPDTKAFAEQVRASREQIRNAVTVAKAKGRVFGIGAAARAATVTQYCGLTADDIGVVCEVPGSDKIGHYMPGTRIPVVDEKILFGDDQPETAVLFSWHVARHIIPKLRERGFHGDILVPLPTVTVWKDQP